MTSLSSQSQVQYSPYIQKGSGAFSEVFRVKRKSDDQDYALKKVKLSKLSEKEKESALNEVRILASIEHENIIGYKEAFFDENSSTLCIVMEFADGGDLYSKITELKRNQQHMNEESIWRIFYDMIIGLKTLHSNKIVHRDIKCANIFLTKEGRAKLGDLNVSKIAKQEFLQTQTGTPFYASPEVWQDKPYDKRSDIWSLGCVMYELAALNPPFIAKDMQGLYQRVLKGAYPRVPSHFSVDLAAVIKLMLQVDPLNRPTCKQIISIPAFKNKCRKFFDKEDSNFIQEDNEDDNQDSLNQMLGTIRIPKNLRLLSERLPKSNYGRKKDNNQSISDKNSSTKSLSMENTQEQTQVKTMEREEKLHSIIEEEPIPDSNKKEQEQTQNAKPQVVVLHQEAAKVKIIENSQIQVSLNKVRSERLIHKRQNKQGIIMNQLAEKSKEIAMKNKSNSVEKIQGQNSFDQSDEGSKGRENQVHKQRLAYSEVQHIPRKQEPINDQQSEQYKRIQEYRKKIQLNQIPKTSPSSRNGIQEVYYEIAHGKAPLYSRKHRMQNIKQMNQNQSQQVIPTLSQQSNRQIPYKKPEISTQIETPQLHQQQNSVQNQNSTPLKIDELQSNRKSSPKKQNIQGRSKIYQRPSRIYSSGKKQQQQSIISSNNTNQEDSIRNSLPPSLPQSQKKQRVKQSQNLPDIQTGRNQNYLITPKQTELVRKERPSLQPISSNQIITPINNLRDSESNHSKLNIPPLMPRTRSRDAISINNNLSNYKSMIGAQRVVEAGRLDSQRLLMENYRKIEQKPQSQMSYIPMSAKRPQINTKIFIPMSQQGKRNLNLDIVPEMPSTRNQHQHASQLAHQRYPY
ncbi:protein kinase domain containing protein [Stylonychia lemnae]|uniref:non-specific serine/threonine protein kinase n=1 Tax=Stylonychia lemnae TaxID=5949 RepID=A0A078AHC7_STYLE|nr:protein kinase domain containing protein [Stylonychia lemnae]|eukprot:CDW81246.1 protein kinase domain containing protein [Stylonychia lemnae]